MVHRELIEHPLEEVLEVIWTRRESGDQSMTGLLENSPEKETESILKDLEAQHLVRIEGSTVSLLPEGEARAEAVVRRHRLAERMLSDVLDVPLSESEAQACLMEHILSPSVTDKVCAFLGHPPTCPHGHPIPAGPCCREKRTRPVDPVVVPLKDLEPGKEGRIVFIAPKMHQRLDRLGSFGVVPGTMVSLRQKRPSLVVEIGGTTLALEKDVAGEIYVRREE